MPNIATTSRIIGSERNSDSTWLLPPPIASGARAMQPAAGTEPATPPNHLVTGGQPARLELVLPTAQPIRSQPQSLLNLTASVGLDSANHSADVRLVQQRLADLGYHVAVDGLYGPQTRAAMKLFGSLAIASDDSDYVLDRLVPGDETVVLLSRPDAPRWASFPRSGVGFKSIDTDGYGFGTNSAVEVLVAAGRRYQEAYRDLHPDVPKILLNDVSRRDGDVQFDRRGRPEHFTHRNGLDIDIRLPKKPEYGTQSGTRTNWRSYDSETTFAMLDAFGSDPNVERMMLFDPRLKARAIAEGKPWADKLLVDSGHKNHLHIDVLSPSAD